jgi:hypothetical protein
MERTTFPFPLAVNSRQHSHYHRFLLGADPAILAPFPKPYCKGSLGKSLCSLGESLTLSSWRKLYHASIPWVPGFGPEHYQVRHSLPHIGLPVSYSRPVRQFAAFDFVQAADPSLSTLALVAGDRRIIDRFVDLADEFCERVEPGIQAQAGGGSACVKTGRMLAGQFFEPNNRWLQPFLHVHSRVLNFTSAADSPERLACIDAGSLGRAGERARRGWTSRQADLLRDLGYQVHPEGPKDRVLSVEGVSERLLASMDAPRIAVLRLLERMVSGDRESSVERFRAELPPAAIAAMSDQLEALLARALCYYKPPKVGIPSEGPWRAAVRQHLFGTCRSELSLLDATARHAKAVLFGTAVFPVPPTDASHGHAPSIEPLRAVHQMPTDPELGAAYPPFSAGRTAPAWILREFETILDDVRARITQGGAKDPVVGLRRILPEIDQLSGSPSPEQLNQAALFIGAELDRPGLSAGRRSDPVPSPLARSASLVPLDELFEGASVVCEREIGGRCL